MPARGNEAITRAPIQPTATILAVVDNLKRLKGHIFNENNEVKCGLFKK